MKLQLQGKTYPLSDVTQATLAELLQLERQSAELGRALTLGELEDMGRTVSAIACAQHEGRPVRQCKACAEARGRHPDSLWLMGASVWLAKRRAGERVSFEEALEFDVRELEFIAEPGDDVDDEATPDPTPARPGSGPGGGHGAASKRAKGSSSK